MSKPSSNIITLQSGLASQWVGSYLWQLREIDSANTDLYYHETKDMFYPRTILLSEASSTISEEVLMGGEKISAYLLDQQNELKNRSRELIHNQWEGCKEVITRSSSTNPDQYWTRIRSVSYFIYLFFPF